MHKKTRERLYHWLWLLQISLWRRRGVHFRVLYVLLQRVSDVMYYGPREYFVAHNTPWDRYLALVANNPVGATIVWTGDKFIRVYPKATAPFPKLPFDYIYGEVTAIQQYKVRMAIGYVDVDGNIVNNIKDL